MIRHFLLLVMVNCLQVSLVHTKDNQNHFSTVFTRPVSQKRKFPASVLLHGLANTCNKLSDAAAAETDKEKQQAALGVIGSIFAMAGNVVSEQEKSAQQTKDDCEKRLVNITEDILHLAKRDTACGSVVSKLPVLGIINKLPEQQRNSLIRGYIASKNNCEDLVSDVMTVSNELMIHMFGDISFRCGPGEDIDEADDKQWGEVDDQTIDLAKAIWAFIVELYHQESIGAYLTDQIANLLGIIKDGVLNALGLTNTPRDNDFSGVEQDSQDNAPVQGEPEEQSQQNVSEQNQEVE